MTDTTTTATARAEDGRVVLDVQDLVVEFKSGRQRVQAVSGVTFQVRQGETLGLVGESGCGKSTTGRTLVQVQPATSGAIIYQGTDLNGMRGKQLRQMRTKIQMIFQDPISSLNPRRRIKDIVAEPLVIWKRGTKEERAAKVREMLEAVGIDPDVAGDRLPSEFSGGQCQRISIARALMADPDLLICDEPVSALDVSVQAQILNLLADLKQQFRLTMVFIAHDLAVVKNVSDRVAVMYLGKLVEVAGSDELYRAAAHPYTEALLASIPEPDPDHVVEPQGADRASSRRPSTHRRAAASAPAAPTPRTAVPPRSPCCATSPRATRWPATSRWARRRARSPHRPPQHRPWPRRAARPTDRSARPCGDAPDPVRSGVREREAHPVRRHEPADQCRRGRRIHGGAVDHEALHRAQIGELFPHVPDRTLVGQGVPMLGRFRHPGPGPGQTGVAVRA